METALISLVCVALLIIGTVTTVFTSFKAATSVSDSLKQMEEKAATIRRTDITATVTGTQGNVITAWVTNIGQTRLADFAGWDVIARYTAGGTPYVTYLTQDTASPPGNNMWASDGIYLIGGNPEVFEPDILNNGEKIKILIKLSPALSNGESVLLTFSTEYGVTAECQYTR
jgi:hypothetical protein